MAERDASPGTSSPASPPVADRKSCTNCGTTIDPTEWHPVATTREEEFEVHPFCDEQCRELWLDDR